MQLTILSMHAPADVACTSALDISVTSPVSSEHREHSVSVWQASCRTRFDSRLLKQNCRLSPGPVMQYSSLSLLVAGHGIIVSLIKKLGALFDGHFVNIGIHTCRPTYSAKSKSYIKAYPFEFAQHNVYLLIEIYMHTVVNHKRPLIYMYFIRKYANNVITSFINFASKLSLGIEAQVFYSALPENCSHYSHFMANYSQCMP